MNVGQRFWTRFRTRRARRALRWRAAAARQRRIWCELLEPRLALAAPVAANDTYSGLEDSPLTINLPGVIANDSDPDAGDVLSAILVAQTARGTVSLNANGSFTYMPAANFWGPDNFTYRLRDSGGAESNTATVTLGIAAVNDPPVVVNDAYTTIQGLPLTIFAPGIVANDTDPEGFYLTPQVVSPPANGVLTLLPIGGAPTGGFQYAPFDRGPCELPFIGIDSFTYRVRDESETSNLATVTINVSGLGAPPVPIGIPIPAFEDMPVMGQAPGLLSIMVPPGPCAPPGTPPVTHTFSGPASLVTPPQRGVMTVQADGSFTYVPQANFNGHDNFTFRAFNAQQQEVQVLATMVVAPVNDPPHLAPDIYQSPEDTVLTVAPASGVLRNDHDIEGHTLVAQLVQGPANGILTDGSPFPFWPNSILPSGGFTYIPHANFHGIDSFTYRASDGLSSGSNIAVVTIVVTPVNDFPVAVPDTYTVNEDTPLVINAPGVLANDSDFDFDSWPLTAVLAAGPASSSGSLSLNANGSFTFTPAANFNGSVSFTYRARDPQGAESALATVTINVTPVNDPPVANNDAYTGIEDVELNVSASSGVLRNDTDIDTTMPLTAALAVQPANGLLTLNPDGSFRYTPHPNFFGLDSFSYRASDGTLSSSPATVTLTFHGPPEPPVANQDAFSTLEDAPLVIPTPGVLANDADIEGDLLTAILIGQARHGVLSLAPNGSFLYTPNANYWGPDSFTYRARDHHGFDSNTATATITVHRSPEPPIATNDTFNGTEDQPLVVAAPGVLANDSEDLTAYVIVGPARGTLVLNPTGGFTYTPNPDFFGKDSFTYRATDGSVATSIGWVTLNVAGVNDPPLAANDAFQANEDSPISMVFANVLANDSDVDGTPLTPQLVTGPSRGTYTLAPSGSFIYTPPLNFFGTDSFTYRASDGALNSNLATATINVAPIPDPPIAVNDTYSGSEDMPLVVSVPGVLGNDSDVDGDSILAQLVTGLPATHGTLLLNPNGGFVFTPTANFNGVVSFTYRATDGALASNTATVTINIFGCQSCGLIAVNDAYTVLRNTQLNIPAPGVLANDADLDGVSLTAVLVAGPARGTLSLNPSGAFRYLPDFGLFGTDSFTYRNFDGQIQSNTATVTIQVTAPANSPPVAINETYTLGHCAASITLPAALGLLKNDLDVDGDLLTALLVSGPATGTLSLNALGGFTYTPAAHSFGVVSFTYRASDGIVFSNAATVWILPSAAPNMRPLTLNDQFTATVNGALHQTAPGVLANDQDDCGNTILSAQLVAGPAHGTLSLQPSGGFHYAPAAGFEGTDSFVYRASDGLLGSNLATVTIAVVPTNNQPPVAVQDRYTTARGIQLSGGGRGVLGNDLDPEGRPLTAALGAGPAHGTLSLADGGAFTYMPVLSFTGSDSFTYRASDGLATSGIATVTIAVAGPGENTPPVANHDQFYAIEDNSVAVFPGVLANDTDAQGDLLTTLHISGPEHGTLSLGATGSFRYEPAANFDGLDRFTYRASDGSLSSEVATVSILVVSVNDVPAAADETYDILEDQPLNVAAPGVLANDFDVDGDLLTAVLVSGPEHGTLSLSANGSFTYLHFVNFIGTDNFTYRASDGVQSSAAATVTINVGLINFPPVFAKGPNQITNDSSGPQAIQWATNISPGQTSEANQSVTFVLAATNPHLFAALPAIDSTGRLTFIPAFNVSGTSEVTVRLQDSGEGDNTSLPQTFTITINKPFPGHNARNRLDTNDDGFVSPIDAVLVINFTNVVGAGPIARPPLPGIVLDPGFYPDVDGDNFLSPIDAVLVINSLNATAAAAAGSGPGSSFRELHETTTGEGESAAGESASAASIAITCGVPASHITRGAESASLGDTSLFELLALDIAHFRRRFPLVG